MKIPARRAIKSSALAVDRAIGPVLRRVGVDTKGWYEYAYWRSRRFEEGELGNDFYRDMFTTHVGLDEEFYRDKRVLDVGCGPRGSLEWADHAAERVGVDSLVGRYRALGIDDHEMTYVDSGAENLPFDDEHFDVVTSFNSLDHVDDVDSTVDEMTRVLAPGGTLIVVVDIHRQPTIAEPHTISWDFASDLAEFDIVDERHLEKRRGHDYLADQVSFDHDDPQDRYGALLIVATKRPAGQRDDLAGGVR